MLATVDPHPPPPRDPVLALEGVAVTVAGGDEVLHGVDLAVWPGAVTV